MIHYYCVRYLDSKGYCYSHGYANSLELYHPGEIIDNGTNGTIQIDYELTDSVLKDFCF